MNNVRNSAQTTPHLREAMARRVQEDGLKPQAVAATIAIGERTVCWRPLRYVAASPTGLQNRSRWASALNAA